jgi:catechol 2,3-dioxygenase-like lactoylglutathione lyase family enzyme
MVTPETGQLLHIGFVVADIERAVASYEPLGINRFARMETAYTARFRRAEVEVRNLNAFARWNETTIELVQPCIGDGIQRDWLRTRGEGMYHIAIAVDDPSRYDFAETVFEVPDHGVTFLDTVAELGYYLELVPLSLSARVEALLDSAD